MRQEGERQHLLVYSDISWSSAVEGSSLHLISVVTSLMNNCCTHQLKVNDKDQQISKRRTWIVWSRWKIGALTFQKLQLLRSQWLEMGIDFLLHNRLDLVLGASSNIHLIWFPNIPKEYKEWMWKRDQPIPLDPSLSVTPKDPFQPFLQRWRLPQWKPLNHCAKTNIFCENRSIETGDKNVRLSFSMVEWDLGNCYRMTWWSIWKRID